MTVNETAKRVQVSRYLEQIHVNILFVGDNLDELDRVRQVLQQAKVSNRLHVVGDGMEAMAYLLRNSPYVSAPKPNLVLLSMNLPRKSEIDVLVELKTNPEFAEVNVVMLTGSESDRILVKNCICHDDGSIQQPFSQSHISMGVNDYRRGSHEID